MSDYVRILSISKIKDKLICTQRRVTKVTIIWIKLIALQNSGDLINLELVNSRAEQHSRSCLLNCSDANDKPGKYNDAFST